LPAITESEKDSTTSSTAEKSLGIDASSLCFLNQASQRGCADFLTTLQTGSGAYLAVYLASHVNSVFVLGRHFGIETDWQWATGAPTGVLADAWNIRLLPHYSIAVFLVIAHLSCGLRAVMQAHQFAAVRRDTITWALIGVGVVVAIAITAALLG
jgi:hypothetical protein